MELHLTPDQEAFFRQGIEAGRFRGREDAVQEAMSLWVERERQRLEIVAAVDRAEASLARSEGVLDRGVQAAVLPITTLAPSRMRFCGRFQRLSNRLVTGYLGRHRSGDSFEPPKLDFGHFRVPGWRARGLCRTGARPPACGPAGFLETGIVMHEGPCRGHCSKAQGRDRFRRKARSRGDQIQWPDGCPIWNSAWFKARSRPRLHAQSDPWGAPTGGATCAVPYVL
jgi:Arc/MetJ-type ribon-helix-helix transcriptional regulator